MSRSIKNKGRRNIDPKKEYYERRRKKKNSTIKLISVIVAFLCLVITIITIISFCTIEEINVVGNNKYTKEQILEKLDVKNGDNLYTFNKFKVEKAIKEKLPYIGEIKIKRKLFTTLNIEITDAKADFEISVSSEKYLCDKDFKVLEKVTGEKETGITKVYGLEVKKVTIGKVLEFKSESNILVMKKLNEFLNMDNTKTISYKDIDFIDINNKGYYTFLYKGYALTRLPNFDNLIKKKGYFDLIISENPESPCIITLDSKSTYKPATQDDLYYGGVAKPNTESEVSKETTNEVNTGEDNTNQNELDKNNNNESNNKSEDENNNESDDFVAFNSNPEDNME